jgi:hypothetical protein
MGYLKCEMCWGYYKLRQGESPEDFEKCQCGGNLKYFENYVELLSDKSTAIESNKAQSGVDNLKYGNKIFCLNFGIPNPLKANYCTMHNKSRAEISDMSLKCNKCGNINPIGSNFCFNCGKKLKIYRSNSNIQSQIFKLDKDENSDIFDSFAKFNGKGTILDVQITPNSISTINNGNKLVYNKTEIENLIFDNLNGQLYFDFEKRTMELHFLIEHQKNVEKALKAFGYSFL